MKTWSRDDRVAEVIALYSTSSVVSTRRRIKGRLRELAQKPNLPELQPHLLQVKRCSGVCMGEFEFLFPLGNYTSSL
jgi:hypothetical protein